jgi:hypothetical protein
VAMPPILVAGLFPDVTLEEQVDRSIGYLASLSPGWALKTAGVYSDDFWLGNAL